MNALISQLFPLLYGACFLVLLWQAFKVMGQGFRAVPRPGDPDAAGSSTNATATASDPAQSPRSGNDRTGRLTIHPELLDADGQLTQEDLLTVRFSGDNEQPAYPGDPS